MSHDLVTLGIATQNMTPNNPALDARPLFQAALSYVQTHTVQTLTVDTGSYYLLTPEQSSAVLVFPQLSNITIDLAGSTFFFNMPLLTNGFELYFCTNVTFTNFQTDYVTPPYTHVQISSVDTVNRIIHYQDLAGWPDPTAFNNLVAPFGGTIQYVAAFFRNGNIIPGTSRTYLVAPFSNSELVLLQDNAPWTQAATLSTFEPGDTVVVAARAGGPPVLVWQSDSITLSNASIYGSNQWAVELYETSNTVVEYVNVMPRPGTGLIGSNADGIHFNSTYQNNHIRHCYVTRTEDDALIMDSMAQATVVAVNGPQELTVQRSGYDRFPNGTAVNFFDPVSTAEFTGATIVSQSPADSVSPGYNEQVTLTFNTALPTLSAGQFMVYGTPALRGSGGTLEDNTVEDTLGGRGIWMNGVMNVTAERNVIRQTSEGAISLSQDTEAFPSPPVSDILVTDNVLENAAEVYGAGTGVQDSLGAVQVVSTNNQSFGFASTPSNSNVTIQNNYIADSGRSGIWVGELNGGLLQNNLVIRSSENPTLGGTFGIPPAFASQVTQDALMSVVMHYDSAVTETGDTVSATSSITAPLTMTPPSIALPVAGATGSFTLQTAITGFNWSASSDSSWLTITSTSTGDGNGSLQYAVTPNNTGLSRTAHIAIAGETFTVTQPAQLQFVPVAPCRIADTRNTEGAFGGPKLAGGTSREFVIPSSACKIPSNAAAYSLNVTVVPDAALGYVTVWPSGQSQPVVSTLNSLDGRTKANAAIVPAGPDGGVEVFASNSTQLVLDIDGYFIPATGSTLAFYPVTPCRIADTRNSTGALAGPYLSGGAGRAFPVLSSACSISSTATAYSLNFTAVPHGPLGYISVWPTGQSQPLVSTLNALTGEVTANAAIVPAGSAGDISVFASNDTDLVIDVNGYFAPAGTSGLSLYTLAPCRVLDTRESSGAFTGTAATNVSGSACGGLASTAQAFVLNGTAVPSGQLGYLTLWPDGGIQPYVSTLNSLDGVVTSNMAIVPTTNGSIDAFASNATQLVLDISGFFAP